MNLADLKAPFAPNKISWRVGSTTKDKTKGMALAYIDARDVQDRLDEVCGVNGWQCRYVPMHDKKTVCEIGVFCQDGKTLQGEWIWKSDGAGDSDIEAEKGALSDAFKRAGVRWGIGRYLYDLESPWVELDTYEKDGKTFAKCIKAREYKRLEALLAGKDKPAQRDAIHGASTLKTPVAAEAYAPPRMEAKPVEIPKSQQETEAREWGEWALPRVKTMDKDRLDKFQAVNKKNLVALKALDPKTSVELEKALADRLEVLFA